MARFVYAKVYCDILRHPLFRSRPDFETKLVLGLILEAKEHTEDGVLRKLTAEDARALCHIKASVQKVQEAIDYLVAVGWLIPHPELAYEIKDFLPRQEADSAADRMARWRETHRDDPVTKRNEDPKRKSDETVTKRNAVRNSASPDKEGEVDVEEEVEKNKNKILAAEGKNRPLVAGEESIPPEKPKAAHGKLIPVGATTPIWRAYSAAFEKRYGAAPPSNGRNNGMLAQLIARIGAEEAPAVAAFYVEHPKAKYVVNGHPVGMLLQDCETLRTEWVTGNRTTETAARLQDRSEANLNGWSKHLSTAKGSG